jgi:mono/diheme cytochrome c family protein
MRVTPPDRVARGGAIGVAMSVCALAGALGSLGHAAQPRTVAQGVYSEEQARRGQQIYVTQCVTCHGETLGGGVGPMLAGDVFLSAWAGRPLADLVDKIQNTMPPLQPPGALTRQQSTDLAARILEVGKFPASQAELTAAQLPQIAFPAAQTSPVPAAGGAVPFTASANLAQVMRAVTFPNANILFNVQVKDPGAQKPTPPVPFDYVLWGSTMYPGWQAVDLAALALLESTPLFLLPGRRCENGRPVPVDRPDWKQFTQALVEVSKDAYRASQTRSQDAVVRIVDRLNDACANCHKVYRDGAAEGAGRGTERCL